MKYLEFLAKVYSSIAGNVVRKCLRQNYVISLLCARSTWLRAIDEDVQHQNFGVHTTWRKAKDRDSWHQVVSTATLC